MTGSHEVSGSIPLISTTKKGHPFGCPFFVPEISPRAICPVRRPLAASRRRLCRRSIPLISTKKRTDAFVSVLFFFGGARERTAGSNMSVSCRKSRPLRSKAAAKRRNAKCHEGSFAAGVSRLSPPTKNALLFTKSAFFVYPSRRLGISSAVRRHIITR